MNFLSFKSKRLSGFALISLLAVSAVGTVMASDNPLTNISVSPELLKLMTAVNSDEVLISDLQSLTDEVGGRLTGSQSNEDGVEWALARLKLAKVNSWKEAFEMPHNWQETKVSAVISGDANFTAGVVSKPFSAATPASGLVANLVDGGFGFAEDMKKLGDTVKGAWVLVETPVLDDEIGLNGLFKEYEDAVPIETAVINAGAAGIVFMSSRPKNLLFRHTASRGYENALPLLVMERETAQRSLRLLREGKHLKLKGIIQTQTTDAFTSYNVIAEIPGTDLKDEIVVFGAHLDSFDLGTGALDNGANVVMLMNIARQIQVLNLHPRRTIRFGLWNGEEQGFYGSRAYTRRHQQELNQHKIATSFDIGSGRINGFFTGARPEVAQEVDKAMAKISVLGPFTQIDQPIVGTDNFDFMLEGVANLVANQEDANYASNYHAQSDTFDKVDQKQLKLNSAIAAALIWYFATADSLPARQSLTDLEKIFNTTDLEAQMRSMNVWEDWQSGNLGLRRAKK